MRSSTNIVDALASVSPTKKVLERWLAEMGIGVIEALKCSALSHAQAAEDFFTLDNFQAVKRRKLSRDLLEFFSWGMELEDVVSLTPSSLAESHRQMMRLTERVLRRSVGAPITASPADIPRVRRSA